MMILKHQSKRKRRRRRRRKVKQRRLEERKSAKNKGSRGEEMTAITVRMFKFKMDRNIKVDPRFMYLITSTLHHLMLKMRSQLKVTIMLMLIKLAKKLATINIKLVNWRKLKIYIGLLTTSSLHHLTLKIHPHLMVVNERDFSPKIFDTSIHAIVYNQSLNSPLSCHRSLDPKSIA